MPLLTPNFLFSGSNDVNFCVGLGWGLQIVCCVQHGARVLAAQVLTKLVAAFLISNKLKFHQAEVSFKKRIK